jgi:hypothetical protein
MSAAEPSGILDEFPTVFAALLARIKFPLTAYEALITGYARTMSVPLSRAISRKFIETAKLNWVRGNLRWGSTGLLRRRR